VELNEDLKVLLSEKEHVQLEIRALEAARSILLPKTASKISGLNEGSNYGKVKEAIEGSFMVMPDQFTVRDVENSIKTRFPKTDRPSISSYLKQFTLDGVLEIVKEGSGPNPAIYRVK
jgi:hypothetical protein